VRRVMLLLRGLWWRRGLTAAVLAVAVATTTTAALGPLYARAAAESVLQDHLIQAGPAAGLALKTDLDIGTPRDYAAAQRRVPRPGEINGYNRMIAGLYTAAGVGTSLATGGSGPPTGAANTHLVWRDGQCRHLIIVSGRCPSAPNEALASQRTIEAKVYQWKLGRVISLGPITLPDDPNYGLDVPDPKPVRIVGTYRPKDTNDPFWFGYNYFDAHPGAADGPDTVDSLFVDRSEFTSLARNTFVEADFDYPLTPSAVRLDDVPSQRTAVRGVLELHPATATIKAETDLLKVLDAAAREHRLVNIGTLLVTLQLALLAWLVLFQVVSDAIEARGNEIAMAKLRGHSPAATIRFGLGEPVALLAAAVPIGVLLAVVVTHLFAASVLVTGVPIVLTWPAVLTALVAFAGGAVAAVLAGHRTLTRSVLDQWRRTTRAPGHGRLVLLLDAVLAAAAIAGLFALREAHQSGTSNDTAALLAPGLLVFAVAIVGVRLLPLACRSLARLTRGSRRVGVFLASRQVARRPVGLRLAALLAVAVGLATFAVAGETIATTNRGARADAELGADRVASVQFNKGLDPVTAVRRADPNGTWAMAAATWLPDGGGSVAGTVLGVDATRLAAVGAPAAGGPSLSDIARTITGSTAPIITFTDSRVRVHLLVTALRGTPRAQLQLNLATPTQPYYDVEGAPLRLGAHTYVLTTACRAECLLRGVTWDRPYGATMELGGTVAVTGIDIGDGTTWKRLDIGLDQSDSWRPAVPEGHATDRVTVTAAGVQDEFTNADGGYGGVAYAYAPSPMPAVATARAIVTGSTAPKRPQMSDTLNNTAYFRVAAEADVLPAVLDDGVVFDVRYLLAELPGFVSEANWQVWIGPHAPGDALQRLTAAGFQIQGVRTHHARVTVLGRQAPALALLLLLACAIAGAVLAVGGTAISISANGRRRSYEIAALQAVGTSRGSLLAASVAEQLLLLGTAVLLGVPTGLLAARLAMPVIPEFADHTPITLRYTPQWGPTLAFAGAFVLLLAITAFIAAWGLLRIAVPARLRESE
jgi:putative ABC transport system permease protein